MPITNFTIAETPADEAGRLAALEALGILNAGPIPELDALVSQASMTFGVPTVLVSLVSDEQQWFAARVGLKAGSTPRTVSFCAHALHSNAIFEVPDTALDERFAGNPLVLDGPRIRYYAGAPLVTKEGYRLGTLCLIDSKPRPPLDEADRAHLLRLAQTAVSTIEGGIGGRHASA
jgi:GAF domain-containing protein